MADKSEKKQRKEISPEETEWFVRMSDGSVYGPIDTEGLLNWTEDGRIMPDDEVSVDRAEWSPAKDLQALGMEVMVELSNGNFLGPFNTTAIELLIKEGKIPEKARRFHVSELEKNKAPAQDETAQGDSLFDFERQDSEDIVFEKDTDNGNKVTVEKIQAEYEEKLAELKHQYDDATAQWERELDALRGELETVREKLSESEEKLTHSVKAEEELKVLHDKLSGENARYRTELEDAAKGEEASARLESELGALRDELETTAGKLSESEQQLQKSLKAEAELKAQYKNLSEENARFRAELEESEQILDKVKKTTALQDELTGLVSENSSLKQKLDDVNMQFAELQLEFNELLAFSNERDATSKDKIRELTKRLETSPEVGFSSSTSESILGSQRVINDLESRLEDAVGEVEELRASLVEANARAASAGRPGTEDITTIKDFANGALELLRKTLEEEKERNTAARANSADLQSSLHDGISNLERILRREPGEASRSEAVALRLEKQAAQLQQELDVLRRQHAADLARAAENEKALEGRVRSIAQKEAQLREKLSRVEQRTADYDSLSSKLRRRESALLAAEKDFEEARQQWQIVESTLQHRIEELERGSGFLFDDDDDSDTDT